MVTTISRNISPTPRESFPFEAWTSLIRKGAPATVDSTIRPTFSGSSSGITSVITYPRSGTSAKFAMSARITRRAFFSGSMIWPTVRLRPVANMLPTTNVRPASVAIVETNWLTVIDYLGAQNPSWCSWVGRPASCQAANPPSRLATFS